MGSLSADLRVLIVDDDETNRDVLQCLLDSWRISGDCAESGAQALEKLSAAAESGNAYDVAILDKMMPEMDGLELAERIQQNPSISSAVLIMLSGDIERSSIHGIAAHLTKPVRPSHLYNAIVTAIKGRFRPGRGHAPGYREPVQVDLTPILLAEDNPINQQVCSEMLETLGYRRLDIVSNGIEVLQALSRKHYGLILMDCQMPEMDGYEAARLIRKKENRSSPATRTSIVALTAHAMKGAMEHCLAAGMDEYLPKPFTLDQLKSTLDRCLSRREPAAAEPTYQIEAADEADLESGAVDRLNDSATIEDVIIGVNKINTLGLLQEY
jgi:CheY-like chemotaxis protein